MATDIANEENTKRQLELLEKIGKIRVLLEHKEKKIELDENKKSIKQTENIPSVHLTKSKVDENAKTKKSLSMLNINSNEFKTQKYKPSWLEISGNIENAKRGNTVLLTITKPDSTTQTLKVFHTKDGYYQTKLFLDSKFSNGQYFIKATYNENQESTSFRINTD